MNRQERRRAAKSRGETNAEKLAQGFQHYQHGDLKAAESYFRDVLLDQPNDPEAQRLLGEVLSDRDQFKEAIGLLRSLVSQHPREYTSHYALGNAFRLAGQNDAAIAAYKAALTLKPGFAGALHGLGLALRSGQHEREALECFRLALQSKPDWAVAWQDMGLTLAILGDLALAEAALRRAISLQPGLGAAHRCLAALRQDQAETEELTRLAAACDDPRTQADERIDMLFALGRLADKAGKFDEGFKYFSAANGGLRVAQAKKGIAFDRKQLSRRVDELIKIFSTPTIAAYAGTGIRSEDPVFIVGMPRAGSTLFEQIAASHSQVFGAGETFGIGEIVAKIGEAPGAAWTSHNIGAAAHNYLEGIRRLAGPVHRIVDKMPDNVFQLGLIAVLFPKARVIFCERDERDVALSCFFQNFAKPYAFDTDLDDCLFRIRETERLCAHWRNTIPLSNMTMSYEALLADPEGESRRLIAFLGLEWEPQCLEFYRHPRAIRTASWAQVRQPLYRSSAGRWQNYEVHFRR
jgi:Flp pilus assembly protein TadD